MNPSLPESGSKSSLSLSTSGYKANVSFSLDDGVGALLKALQITFEHGVSLSSIKSLPPLTNGKSKTYDFMVDFNVTSPSHADLILEALINKGGAKRAEILKLESNAEIVIPWFPRCMTDLDTFASKVLSYGTELEADHPGFKDEEYRKRRAIITENALKYRTGQLLPDVDYTEEEVNTWTVVLDSLLSLYPTHACREYRNIFNVLLSEGIYSRDKIPQIRSLSQFLKARTGFTLRPVMGLLSSRDFLNGLAFRVFHSTQYIRHPSKPFYTPEPDVIHELLGHVPLFADPDFADFSHELGLASLGASDDEIKKLATIYWFTVEFGLCQEHGQVKAYGAGILSSKDELEYALTSTPEKKPFDPSIASVHSYPITKLQPLYFVAESFRKAKEKVRHYAEHLDRPFAVMLNPSTESIEVLDSKEKLVRYIQQLKASMHTLLVALEKLGG